MTEMRPLPDSTMSGLAALGEFNTTQSSRARVLFVDDEERILTALKTIFRGRFTERHATRLLWRAGFGPKPGDPHRLARLGLDGAVASLTRPGGPEPHSTVG